MLVGDWTWVVVVVVVVVVVATLSFWMAWVPLSTATTGNSMLPSYYAHKMMIPEPSNGESEQDWRLRQRYRWFNCLLYGMKRNVLAASGLATRRWANGVCVKSGVVVHVLCVSQSCLFGVRIRLVVRCHNILYLVVATSIVVITTVISMEFGITHTGKTHAIYQAQVTS